MLELRDKEALELVTAHRRWLFNDRRGKQSRCRQGNEGSHREIMPYAARRDALAG